MSLRFITGRSGQGKTTAIIHEVIRRSLESPGKQFYVIVPEQFSLEMQRSLAENHPDHGYMNIDVLSFYRLAYLVFDECGYTPHDILEDFGVSMILRRILSEHEKEFAGLGENRKREGYLDELKSMLMEFICYGISRQQLSDAEGGLEDFPVLLRKCQELSLLYDYFEETVRGRFMVTEQILHILCDFVADSELLSGAVFYFDGFTGFTPVQLLFLKELLSYAEQLNFSVTIPGMKTVFPMNSHEELFHLSRKTIRSLTGLLKDTGIEMDKPLCLDHPTAPRFIHNKELACLEQEFLRNHKTSWNEIPDKVHVISCLQPEQEIDFILHKMEYLIRSKGYRYRDFAILTGDIERYASVFERQARLLGIPFFIDSRKKMSYHPSVETIRALFQLAESNYSYESVFRYLKSGMTDLDDEDIDFLENYIIASGIRGYSMWKQPFARKMQNYSEEEQNKLEMLRICVMDETETFYKGWKNTGLNVIERMELLYNQMCHLDFAGKLMRMADEQEKKGNYVLEKEYREVFSYLVTLLDKIVDIFGEENLPMRELSELMDTGMESLGLGVLPLSADQLILGDLKRTRLSDIKILFIAGLNDGVIPPPVNEGGILSEDERKILEEQGIVLSQRAEEQSLEDEFYMYLAFARPREEIWFSFSSLGRDGKILYPSPILKELGRIFPRLTVKQYPDDEKRQFFNVKDSKDYLVSTIMDLTGRPDGSKELNDDQRMLLTFWLSRKDLRLEFEKLFMEKERRFNEGNLAPKLAEQLFGLQLKTSVTRLEQYAACPYQYFCLYGMGLSEREEYEISSMDIGNLFHRAMDYYSRCVKSSEYSWKTIPEDVREEFLERSIEHAVDSPVKDVMDNTARNRYKMTSVKRILDRTVRILSSQLAISDFEPDRFELHFGKTDSLKPVTVSLEHDRTMYLEGFIDRVDLFENDQYVLIRVIDYKSGMKNFRMDELYHGMELQLILYMKVARELYQEGKHKKILPAGMYYYQVKDPIIRLDQYDEAAIRKNFQMAGYTNSDPEILTHTEHQEGKQFSSVAVRLGKDGHPVKTASVMSTEDFLLLEHYAEEKMKETGSRIYSGDVRPHPYRGAQWSACDYCPYSSVCGFDPREGYHYNEWKKMTDKEVLEAIRKQVE